MILNPDFRDLLKILNEFDVKYLLVCGYAVMYFTEPRFTKDIDLWVEPTKANALKVWDALAKFGAPLEQVQPVDFYNKELVYQIGIAPNRIDIMMHVPGLEFQSVWSKRVVSNYIDATLNILNIDELIIAKQTSGREQDLWDLKNLQKAKRNLQNNSE